MAAAPRILILGAGGVFGKLLTAELLAHTSAQLVLVSRDSGRADRLCQSADGGLRTEPLALDLTDVPGLARAAAGCGLVACAAGPFQRLDSSLVSAVVQAGAHWVDIADDPDWVLGHLRDASLANRASQEGVTVLTGQSCTPALSGALARWLVQRSPGARNAVVTLCIGNRNSKGAGAIESALSSPFDGARLKALAVGTRLASRFRSADDVLLRERLGLSAQMWVGFERPVITLGFASLARVARRIGPTGRPRLAALVQTLAAPLSHFGSDIGSVQVDLFGAPGQVVRATLVGHGQRLAVLPAALAIEAILRGDFATGVPGPAEWIEAESLLGSLRERGVKFLSTLPGEPIRA